jgi:capsular polysaccharide transport system permease protein
MIGMVTSQWRSLRALIVRDIIARYGRDNVGFVWVIIEPMVLCAGVALFWWLVKPPYMNGVEIVAFVITGYMPLTLFRHLTNPFTNILTGNKSTFFHRRVSVLDVVLARGVMEFTGATLAFGLIYFFLTTIRICEPIEDIRLVLAGWLTLAWLAFGVGLCIAALTETNRSAHHFVQPLQYLTVPLSPVFYAVDWLPTEAQNILYYNPLSHPYEMIRAGFFGPNFLAHYDPKVPLLVGLVLVSFGLWAVQAVRDRINDH